VTYLEQLQIANYGMGGHYEPHFDHARDNEDKFTDLGMGNRIATILYYVSRQCFKFPKKKNTIKIFFITLRVEIFAEQIFAVG